MKVIWQSLALDDLQHIEAFITEEWENPTLAVKTVQTIYNFTREQLKYRSGRPGRVPGTFELVIQGGKLPYICVYREAGGNIEVLRVYHTSRRWPEEF